MKSLWLVLLIWLCFVDSYRHSSHKNKMGYVSNKKNNNKIVTQTQNDVAKEIRLQKKDEPATTESKDQPADASTTTETQQNTDATQNANQSSEPASSETKAADTPSAQESTENKDSTQETQNQSESTPTDNKDNAASSTDNKDNAAAATDNKDNAATDNKDNAATDNKNSAAATTDNKDNGTSSGEGDSSQSQENKDGNSSQGQDDNTQKGGDQKDQGNQEQQADNKGEQKDEQKTEQKDEQKDSKAAENTASEQNQSSDNNNSQQEGNQSETKVADAKEEQKAESKNEQTAEQPAAAAVEQNSSDDKSQTADQQQTQENGEQGDQNNKQEPIEGKNLKMNKKARQGCFKLKQDCSSNPYNCEEGLQCLRFCDLEQTDCGQFCVMGLDGSCQDDSECFSEFCNGNKCTERKKAGESCSKPNECLYFKCEGGKCWQPPVIKNPEGGQKIKGIGGIECEAEYKAPVEPKGLLSPCKDNNECESPEDMICQDGSCKMRINKYCFVNNERGVCQAVCEGNAICSQLPVLKADWLNGPLKEKNTYNTLVEEYSKMKFSKQQQFQVVFEDFIKLLLNRDSIQQAGNAHNPDGNRYMNNYICKIPVGGECKEAIECATNKCSNGLCLKKQLNEECEQDYECATENCYNEDKAQKPTCQESKDAGAPCEFNNNCKSKLCQPQKVIWDQAPVEIKVAGSKFCDDEKLGLNDLCTDHSQCGENAEIQLRCEYSDVINAFGQNEFGWTMNDMFSRFYAYWKVIDYPVNKGKTGNMAIWLNENSKPIITQEEILNNMKYGSIKKCKHPRNSECDSDAQCPHRNRCENGRCRGLDGALCSSNVECDNTKGLICGMTTEVDSLGFGRSICEKGGARFKKTVQANKQQNRFKKVANNSVIKQVVNKSKQSAVQIMQQLQKKSQQILKQLNKKKPNKKKRIMRKRK